MVSKLADQSRSASLIASLSVRPPLSTGITRRAHQLHPEDVELLPLDVLRAHVDDRLEPEQRADDRGGDAMLAGAGLGDQPGLAHAPGEQPLPEHLVGLVRAAVEQVLALQIDVAGQVAAAGQRRRPPGIIGEQAVELGRERRIVLRVEEGRLELLQRRHQDFGHIAAAEAAEAAAQAHARNRSRDVRPQRVEQRRDLLGRLAARAARRRAEPTSIA